MPANQEKNVMEIKNQKPHGMRKAFDFDVMANEKN